MEKDLCTMKCKHCGFEKFVAYYDNIACIEADSFIEANAESYRGKFTEQCQECGSSGFDFVARICAQGDITFKNTLDEPETWANSLLIQFECYTSLSKAWSMHSDSARNIAIEPANPSLNGLTTEASDPPLGVPGYLANYMTLLKKRFFGFYTKATCYRNAMIIAFDSEAEMIRAVAVGHIRLRKSISEADREEAQRREQDRLLAEDPIYFANMMMQISGIKHGNKKCHARDQYYFEPILYSAICDRRDMERLLAMAELTEDRLAPFADDRSNHLLAAIRKVYEMGVREPTLEHVVNALDALGLLEAAGGKSYLEQQIQDRRDRCEKDRLFREKCAEEVAVEFRKAR